LHKICNITSHVLLLPLHVPADGYWIMWAIIWNWNMKKKYLELYIELIKLFVVSTVYEKKVCTVLPWWSTILPISTKWTTTSLSSNHWDQSHLHSKESYSTKEEEEHDLWCCKFYAIFIKLNQFFSRRGIWLVVFGADCISRYFFFIFQFHIIAHIIQYPSAGTCITNVTISINL
jgi:hypothetical protein